MASVALKWVVVGGACWANTDVSSVCGACRGKVGVSSVCGGCRKKVSVRNIVGGWMQGKSGCQQCLWWM